MFANRAEFRGQTVNCRCDWPLDADVSGIATAKQAIAVTATTATSRRVIRGMGTTTSLADLTGAAILSDA
jgi:hypothetical protein